MVFITNIIGIIKALPRTSNIWSVKVSTHEGSGTLLGVFHMFFSSITHNFPTNYYNCHYAEETDRDTNKSSDSNQV